MAFDTAKDAFCCEGRATIKDGGTLRTVRMPKEELQRGFGLSTSTYVVIASMVGTGILISPGYMMASLQNYPVIFGLWALGGLLAICGALCVAELAAALPRSGGSAECPVEAQL